MKIKLLLSIIILAISLNTLTAQNWNEVKQVISLHRDSLGEFGRSVDISGNYAIVGANYETTDTNGLNSIYASGSAYIYEKGANGNWTLAQKIISSDRTAGDYFGIAVAISDNFAIVGSACQDFDASGNNIIVNAGAVYIYERMTNGKWVEIQKIVSNDRDFEDWFGEAIDIYEDYIVVGARGDDYDTLNLNYIYAAGAAYIFKRNSNNTWVQTQKIVASDRSNIAEFGYAVSINGNHVIIGAPTDSLDAQGGNNLAQSGSAYFFELNSYGRWIESTKVTATNREDKAYFGCSVSIFGDKAVVGAWHEGSGVNSSSILYEAGAAYVFAMNVEGNWNQTQKIVAPMRHRVDFFGKSVSISHNTIVVSCYGNDYDTSGSNFLHIAGAAFIFKQNSVGFWNQTQKIVASNRQMYDRFGDAVSISKNNIIVGAPGRGLDTSNTNFLTRSGAAYLFNDCATFSDTTAIVCNNYFSWHGTTYNSSSTPFHVYTNAGGCDSIVTLHLVINNKNIVVLYDTLSSSAIKLTAPSSDHYQWLDCLNGYAILVGDTNQSFIGLSNGSFAVEIKRNNCIDTSACSPFISGLKEDDFNAKPKIYPNPTTKSLTIDLDKNYDKINIRILDIVGRILNEYSLENRQSINLDIQQVPGIYFIEIRMDEEQFVFKIIKE
jgi:hypothetical protein